MNLYHIQDDDRPMYVVALDWQHAREQWRELIRHECNLDADVEIEPDGVMRIAHDHELLLPEDAT